VLAFGFCDGSVPAYCASSGVVHPQIQSTSLSECQSECIIDLQWTHFCSSNDGCEGGNGG
jgi:hypothetical protein